MIVDRPEDRLPKNIVGKAFTIWSRDYDKKVKAVRIRAVKEYPHHILFVNHLGIRECFTRWTLARILI